MKNLIENWLENWMDGLSYLIADDHISFYTFFTVILAECSYLWAFQQPTVAIPFTLILLGYMLNVIVFARLKGNSEGTRREAIFAILYVVVFCILFAIGCIINTKTSTLLTVILFVITALWIGIRSFQDCGGFRTIYMWIISQIIVIGGPFVVFVVFCAKISFLPVALKVTIPLLYLIFSPLIAYFEDDSAAANIFELAYDVTWSKEYEEHCKKIEKLEEDINSKKM